MREIKVGDPVLLHLESPGSVGITEGLLRYKDRRFRVCRIKHFGGTGVLKGEYYELDGCVSEHGVPYGVTGDWIEPIKELDNGCVYGRRK